MFKENKYTRIYFNIMETRKNRILCENMYYENHHIIPKSLGGKNNIENMIYLTAKEHFIVHWLLTKMCEDRNSIRKMKYAFFCMVNLVNRNHKRFFSSRQFEIARKHNVDANKMGNSNKGSKWSDESKKKLSKSKLGNKNRVAKKHSKESKEIMSLKRIGITLSEETKKKMSKSKSGVKKSDETKKNMSIAQKSKEPITCIHCDKSGHYAAMKRWHFDNCKMKSIDNNNTLK